MGTPRIGLIGLGVISRFYLAALERIPSLRLVAVCDRDETAHAPFADRLSCYRDHREMLRRSELDAVVVTVPNDAHASVCRDALETGKAVCVEKPLATWLSEGQALAEYARAVRVPLFTAFHRRYNRAVQELWQRWGQSSPIASMTVRYLERIEDHVGRDRWYLDPARCGGGCIADNGPNAYDLARLFLGELSVVEAAIGRDASGIDREARVVLRADSGATAVVELDWSYDGERKDVEIRLADGTTDRADMLRGYPGFKESLWHEYVEILENFARVLEAGECAADGGLPALALVEASYAAERSMRVEP